MTKDLLRLEHVQKRFGDGDSSITILKDISLTLKRGEFLAIVGPSGSGKSTLLSIIGALLSPSSGKVIIDQENIAEYKPSKLTSVRKDKIGFIFQSSNLIPYLTVKDQLMVISDLSKTDKRENAKKATELLNHLGLSHRSKSLSGKVIWWRKAKGCDCKSFHERSRYCISR